MQVGLTALASTLVAALSLISSVAGTAIPGSDVVATRAELLDFISTTDANLTYIGKSIETVSPFDTMVVYCSQRTQNVCGGACTVYNGNAKCLDAPNTNCLRATSNVGFCDRGGCSGSCNQFSTCGTHLDNGFCFTPGTRSINVPFT